MDLQKLKNKNIKKPRKKDTSTPVRVNENLYKEISNISKVENTSIIKTTEFLLESAVNEYSKLKSKKDAHKRELDYKLIFRYVEIHESVIEDFLEDSREKDTLKKSLKTFKKHLKEHIVQTVDDCEQIKID